MAASAPRLVIVAWEVVGVAVGVDLDRVEQIQEPGPPGRAGGVDEGPPLDVADLWGLSGARGDEAGPVKVLALRSGDGAGTRHLIASGVVRVRRLRADEVAPLPPFLRGTRLEAAIERLFVLQGRVGFIIDVDGLPLSGSK